MADAIEQLVVDPQSRFLEMKSLQPYSTRDEYLYAMKEDLADWLSNMYPDWCPITAENFIETLENGALLCHHANNVNEAARKHSSLSSLTNCKYRTDARPQTFNARDNVSQFIKWSRGVAGVREVLMFESDDLILRKNEKNFILCLLEIARFGAKFGISVPAIIRLEVEIEREIERDKQTATLSYDELKRLQELENEQNLIDDGENQNNFNETFSLSDSNGANEDLTNRNSKQNDAAHFIEEIDFSGKLIKEDNDATTQFIEETDSSGKFRKEDNDNDDEEINQIASRFRHTLEDDEKSTNSTSNPIKAEREKPILPPASSTHLHKTVIHIANACSCMQRFPVIRIGEGKYRIGENGTIIFIRILRNHVMVRVGGGWDTLENYLNKHDPCRRSGHHHRSDHHNHHHSEIPILALSNPHISPSVQKNTPYGKSVTIKTEEFPLPKPSVHDTNLVDAQLVITRGADGRHRIGQITYKAEEDTLNQPPVCPHHHHHNNLNQSLPASPPKIRTVRTTRRSPPLAFYNKQSSPSTDQDYSSLTETTPSKPSSSSSLDFKDDSIDQPTTSFTIPTMDDLSLDLFSPIKKPPTQLVTRDNTRKSLVMESPRPTVQNFDIYKPSISESVIDNIDPLFIDTKQDFDINDIEDVLKVNKTQNLDDDTTNIDNDSLESSEGVLEEPKKSSLPPSTRKSSTHSSAYIAQKQKFQQEQAANRKRSSSTHSRSPLRLSTLPNPVGETKKKEITIPKPRQKLLPLTKRSQSTYSIDKITDISKLDRDSGFDEQDFRRERLQSNGDDNSSVSSIKSARSSTALSFNVEYKQNKSYELRMKKLDSKRNSTDKESALKTGKNSSATTRRGSETNPLSTTTKYRKNSQSTVNLK